MASFTLPEFKQVKKQESSIHLRKASRSTPNPQRPNLLLSSIRQQQIKSSKIKAKRKIDQDTALFSITFEKVNSTVKYPNFDQEILNEFKINGKNVNGSFEKYNLTENDGSTKKVSLNAKYYSNQNQWVDCKVTFRKTDRVISISNNSNESFTLGIDDIECVKIEDNKRVVWINVKKETTHQLGILSECISEAEFFMMAVDFLWKKSCRKTNIFMNCDKYLQCSESPLLHSSDVQWIGASNQMMEYLGQYCYHLKTAQKEIKSLQAVNIYLK